MASGIVEPSGPQEQKKQEEQQRKMAPRAKLVERLLAGAPSLPAFINDLITAQAMVVAGTEAIAFLIEPAEEDGFALKLLAHVRPDEAAPDVRQAAIQAFADIVKPCIVQGKDGAIRIDGTESNESDPQFCLVTLLRSENGIAAVSAVITRCPNEDRAKQRLQLMEIVAGYFDLYTLKRKAEQAQEIAHRHQHVLQYGSAVATSEGFKAAAMNLCNELAARTGATRVSIGWVKGTALNPRVKLQGMSHTEQFDRKQELSVQIEKAMEECLDQEEIVRYDPDGTGSQNIAREATNLARMNGGEQVVSLPLRRAGEVHGIITLEFSPDKKVQPNEATAIAVAVELLGPALYDRHENDRFLITKAGVSTKKTFKAVLGPKYWLAKLITIIVLIGVWLIAGAYVPFADKWLLLPTYRVAAKFAFQATERRVVSAPFEGVLEESYVEPGKIVKKGDKLAKMKTTELEKQLWEAMSRRSAAEARANKAAGEGKEADRQVAMAEFRAATAEAELLRFRKDELAVMKATIDGEVLVGDLREKQGASIKQGDELFQLAARDSMRAELAVAERDIQDLKIGQTVWLATNALPTESKRAVVEQIVPLGQTQEGSNTFKVFAKIEESNEQWRPGMQGEARIEVQKRTLAWQWLHKPIDYLRLKLWM